MTRALPFLILALGVVVAGFVFLNRANSAPLAGAVSVGLDPLMEIETQRADGRTWVDAGLAPVALPASLQDSLLNVKSARLFGGTLYFSDFGDMRVRRVSGDGDLLASIGRGRGQGPGELTSIMDVAVLHDTLWVADGPGRVISAFTTDGAFVGRYPVSYFPMRIVPVGDRLYVVGMGGGDGLFHEIDREGTVVRSFGALFDDQEMNELSLANSMLVPTPDGGFAYLPLVGSLVVLFDAEGALVRAIETIDKRPVMGSLGTSSGGQRASDASLTQNTVSVSGSTLYIHTTWTTEPEAVGTIGETVSAIDRYAYPSGEYLDSFRLPAPAYDALVAGDRLFASSDTAFVSYRFEPRR